MRKKNKEVTDISEIDSIINSSDVCRVAFAYRNIPYIVTMNYGYCGWNEKKIYFHCASEGRKVDMIRKNNYVCFEMDCDHRIKEGEQACDFSMRYRSIVGYGYLSIVQDQMERIYGLNQIMFHYTGKRKFTFRPDSFRKTTILRLDIKEVSGKES